eukprot:2522568-Pleurochrysis_carterae.AAC.2
MFVLHVHCCYCLLRSQQFEEQLQLSRRPALPQSQGSSWNSSAVLPLSRVLRPAAQAAGQRAPAN